MSKRSEHSYGRLVISFTIIAVLTISVVLGLSYTIGIPYNLKGGTSIQTTSTSSTITVAAAPVPASVGIVVKDSWSGTIITTSAGTKLDIINPNDLSKPLEGGLTSTSNTLSSALYYTPNQQIMVHAVATGYYDNVQAYTVPTTLTTISNTQQYVIGSISLIKRVAAASATAQLYDPSGAVDSSTTNINTAGTTGSYNAPSGQKLNTFQIGMRDTQSQTSYAVPQTTLTASFKQVNLVGMAWIAVNSTNIGASALTGAGWTYTQTQPTGWVVAYKQLPEVDSPSTSSLGSGTLSFTVDTSAIAANKFLAVDVWVADLQNPSDTALGATDAAPTAYGAFTTSGLTAVLGKGYATSANLPTAPLLASTLLSG